jgi:peroxiredoxin
MSRLLHLLIQVMTIVIATRGSAITATPQDLKLLTASGQTVSTASLRGKIVVLLFSGIQDPQCRYEFEALSSLAERYRDKAVRIYWVSIDRITDLELQKIRQDCGPTSAISIVGDPRGAAFKRFIQESDTRPQLPTVVILDGQGQMYGQPRGGFNPNNDFVNDIAAVLDKLLRKDNHQST